MKQTKFYNPYRAKYGKDVKKVNIFNPPPLTGENRSMRISKDFNLGHYLDGVFILEEEKNLFDVLPIDSKVINVLQILRDALGKPIRITCSFRSQGHEFKKGRSGKSQHTYGTALDVTAESLIFMLREAIKTKNELFHKLRAAGLNAVGFYPSRNFVHIDVREGSAKNPLVIWYEKPKKKKAQSY
ncbi:D-Ala-D-Ala carboxypeptidase family metallohydrolase [Tenacibaculum maritimum]|nr:D-Ala-D-Ala carboxypeptidase family metallohydrolase [Tenacibaculum maritimum]